MVNDEPNVRLVDAHAKGDRGNDGLKLAAQPSAMNLGSETKVSFIMSPINLLSRLKCQRALSQHRDTNWFVENYGA